MPNILDNPVIINDPVVDPGLTPPSSGDTPSVQSKTISVTLNDNVLTKLTDLATQGTKTITENGSGIDVKRFATVDVAVPGEQLPEYEGATHITSNGTLQTANKKVTSDITVNVSQPANYTGSYNITENGTIAIANKKATQDIVVNVPGSGPSLDEYSYYYQGSSSDNPLKITTIDETGLYSISFYDGTATKEEVEYGNYYMWTGQALDNITDKLPSDAGIYSYTNDGCGPKFEQQYVDYWKAVYWDGDQFNDLYVPYNSLVFITSNQASGCDSWYNAVELPSNVGDEVEVTLDYKNYKIVRLED